MPSCSSGSGGRARLHQVRPAGGSSGRCDRERPPTGIDTGGVRAQPHPAGDRAHRPLPGALARLDDGDAARGVVGDDGGARGGGQGAVGGVSNFDVEQRLERCETIRHVDSVHAPLSARPGRALDGRAVGARARDKGAGLLAARLGSPHGDVRPGAHRALRRGRLASRRAGVPGSAARREPRARGRAACDRGRARDDGHGARDRLVLAQPECHGEYRRCSPAGSRRRLGGRGRSPRARTPSRRVGVAIAATGARSDVPPAPPPHIRPVPDQQPAKEHGA